MMPRNIGQQQQAARKQETCVLEVPQTTAPESQQSFRNTRSKSYVLSTIIYKSVEANITTLHNIPPIRIAMIDNVPKLEF